MKTLKQKTRRVTGGGVHKSIPETSNDWLYALFMPFAKQRLNESWRYLNLM
jgi:hypothetical protein